MQVWRLVKSRHAATACDGEGAFRAGGRLNPKGIRVVYTSATLSLAALEMLLHAELTHLRMAYVAIPITIPDALPIIRLQAEALPPDWQAVPAPPALAALGQQWVAAGESAILQVPSGIVPTESNFILNPLHRDVVCLTIGVPIPFAFDGRLMKLTDRGNRRKTKAPLLHQD
jgi:RES domain-containing protein